MRVNILSDTDWETKIEHALKVLDDDEIDTVLSANNYGNGLNEIVIVLMCRNPDLKFKKRIRFVKKTKTLYMDVMLDYKKFVVSTHKARRSAIADGLMKELRTTLNKYAFESFKTDKFLENLERLLRNKLEGDNSARFDHQCLEVATGFSDT